MVSQAVYPVPAEWAAKAIVDAERYRQMVDRVESDPDGFWREQAARVDWIKPFETVKEVSFREEDFAIRWFADGTLNLSANCLDRHLPAPPKLVDDDRPRQCGLVSFGVAERNRPARRLVEAFERLDEVAEERVSPHLAVGDDVEPGRFLQGNRLVDRTVLDRFERGRRQVAALELLTGVEQELGAQQAADHVGSGGG